MTYRNKYTGLITDEAGFHFDDHNIFIYSLLFTYDDIKFVYCLLFLPKRQTKL